MKQFEFYRFLLTPLTEPELPLSPKSKKEIIEEIFEKGKIHYFYVHGKKYALRVKLETQGYVYAHLGKQSKKDIIKSPEEGFEKQEHEDWSGCKIFVNTNNEKNSGKTETAGQIIAIEINNKDIKNRDNVLQKFSSKINREISKYNFFLSINKIPSEKTNFWNIAKKHEGKIKKVVFTYTPPNLFNLETELEKDLEEANRTYNVTKTQIAFENSEGALILPEDNPLLKQSVKYAELGNASFSIHLTGKKKTISSEDKIKTKTLKETNISIDGNISEEELVNIIHDLMV